MAKVKKEYTTMKIETVALEKARKNKEKTGVPISVFIHKAIDEKLAKPKSV